MVSRTTYPSMPLRISGLRPDLSDTSGPGKAARQMWRVCKQGGVTVVTTWMGNISFLANCSPFNRFVAKT
jgi:hypothetical protein